MSTYTIEQLRSQVLSLTEPERAELAHELIKSLDAHTPADTDVEAAWDQEIARRIAQIDAGQAKLLDREEFRKRLQDRIGNQ